jgi:hypothetical protein
VNSDTSSSSNQTFPPEPDTSTPQPEYQVVEPPNPTRRARGQERDKRKRPNTQGGGPYTKPAVMARRAKARSLNKCVRAARKNNR